MGLKRACIRMQPKKKLGIFFVWFEKAAVVIKFTLHPIAYPA